MNSFVLCGFLFGALPFLSLAQNSAPAGLKQAFDNARYGIEPSGSSLHASNAANRFSVQFSAEQTIIRSGDASETTLTLDEYGWGSALHSAGSVSRVSYSGKRLDRQYSTDLKEWFENSSQGLEQGFILPQRDASASGPLHIRLGTAGKWRALSDGAGLQLTQRSATLQYTGLKAWDARGTSLTSRLGVHGNQIEIEVDDSQAVYPLTIDPAFVQQATLTASDAAQYFGEFVSLSSDGNTALVGATGSGNLTGIAYVFTRSSTGAWTQQAELNAPSGVVAGSEVGSGVLSGDGNTVMMPIFAGTTDAVAGVVYVFTRSGNNWNYQTQLLSPNSHAGDGFGGAIAFSTNGGEVLIGAANYFSGNLGAAYVYTGAGATWTLQATLTTPAETALDGFGGSVALSGDGNTALVGAYNSAAGNGAADIFTRSGTSWSLQQALTSPDATRPGFGSSVALSGDGNTALIGAIFINGFGNSQTEFGAVYAFVRSGAAWTQQQTLVEQVNSNNAYFGGRISLSADGNTALIDDNNFNTTPWNVADVLASSGTTWTLRQLLTTPPEPLSDPTQPAYSQLGFTTALSADASTAIVGLPESTAKGSANVLQFNSTASAGPPLVVSVTPNAGSNGAQNFTAVYSDLNGVADLASVRILFNATPTGPNACYVSYFPPSNQLYLANDANTALIGPVTPGSSAQISNSQCTLSAPGSSYSASGINATLTASIAFVRTPPENIYLLDDEKDTSNSGWIKEGTWGATLGLPAPVSVTPGSGSGRSQIFTAVYSDPNGGYDLATLHLLFSPRVSEINGCSVFYNRAASAFYLDNDNGTELSVPVHPGSTAQVSNTQCTLSGTSSSYSVNGNDATISVALAFNSSTQQQKLIASDSHVSDGFGLSAALSNDGNTALVGSAFTQADLTNPGPYENSGAAYVFTQSATGWAQQKRLSIPNAAAGDYFGSSTALSGDGNTAIVGAPGNFATTGAVYVFTRSGGYWTQKQTLTAPQPAVYDQFGYSLAISGDGNTILVGTGNPVNLGPGYPAAFPGTVYVFTRSASNWVQQGQLTPADLTATNFGSSVAVSSDGTTVLVGATKNNAAYVFTRSGNTWTQQKKFTESGSVAFGSAVALSAGGNNALVADQGSNHNAGAAYLFARSGSTWVQQQTFTASDGSPFSSFGSSVALANAGSTALIGENAYPTGAAYLFTRSGTTWTQQKELLASDAAKTCCGNGFGTAVALSSSGLGALVSAPYAKAAAALPTGLIWLPASSRCHPNIFFFPPPKTTALLAGGSRKVAGRLLSNIRGTSPWESNLPRQHAKLNDD